MSEKLKTLVATQSFTGSGSVARGVPVSREAAGTRGREFVGIIVDVAEGGLGVWVRRPSDDADVSVWYSVNELDVASSEELAQIARFFLNRQYLEVAELRSAIAKGQVPA